MFDIIAQAITQDGKWIIGGLCSAILGMASLIVLIIKKVFDKVDHFAGKIDTKHGEAMTRLDKLISTNIEIKVHNQESKQTLHSLNDQMIIHKEKLKAIEANTNKIAEKKSA